MIIFGACPSIFLDLHFQPLQQKMGLLKKKTIDGSRRLFFDKGLEDILTTVLWSNL